MDKGEKRRKAVELVKDGLIVLMTFSALWLAAQAQMLGPLSGILKEEQLQTGGQDTQSEARADAARPLRISVSLMGETGTGRCGIQYDQTAADGLFQQASGLLMETLSSMGEQQAVSRRVWEQALTVPPSICFDFQGEIPLQVLAGWLAGERIQSDITVRRLVLTVWEDRVALYFRDGVSGEYFRCVSEVASEQHLAEITTSLQDNGAYYAFESDLYGWMDPDTLLSDSTPVPHIYLTENPAAGGQAALERWMETMSLPVGSSSFYSVGDEQVARIGGDNLRLSGNGVMEYHAEEDSTLLPVTLRPENATLFDTVESCRQLAASTVGVAAGQARLYFTGVKEQKDGIEISFDYCLNGVPVRMEEGPAARFLVQNGFITRFTLRFRSYTASGESAVILPVAQAAAAMETMDAEGEELLLTYADSGGDMVRPIWAAVDDGME